MTAESTIMRGHEEEKISMRDIFAKLKQEVLRADFKGIQRIVDLLSRLGSNQSYNASTNDTEGTGAKARSPLSDLEIFLDRNFLTYSDTQETAKIDNADMSWWAEFFDPEWKRPPRPRSVFKKEIIVPEDAVRVGLEGSNAYCYLHGGRLFRLVNWKRLSQSDELTGRVVSDLEMAGKDLEMKLRIAEKDPVGLSPAVYEYDPQIGTFVMEYLEGRCFSDIVGDLPTDSCVQFLEDLFALHESGLYHGDLTDYKHWWIDPDGKIRLIDFTYQRDAESKDGLIRVQQIDLHEAIRKLEQYGFSLETDNVRARVDHTARGQSELQKKAVVDSVAVQYIAQRQKYKSERYKRIGYEYKELTEAESFIVATWIDDAKKKMLDCGIEDAAFRLPTIEQIIFVEVDVSKEAHADFNRVRGEADVGFIKLFIPKGASIDHPEIKHVFMHELSHFVPQVVLEYSSNKKGYKELQFGFERYAEVESDGVVRLEKRGIWEETTADLFALLMNQEERVVLTGYGEMVSFMTALVVEYASKSSQSPLEAFKLVIRAKTLREISFLKELSAHLGIDCIRLLNTIVADPKPLYPGQLNQAAQAGGFGALFLKIKKEANSNMGFKVSNYIPGLKGNIKADEPVYQKSSPRKKVQKPPLRRA